MSRLGEIRDWLLPALIHLDPMVAMAYYHSVAVDRGSTKAAISTPPRKPLRGVAGFDVIEVSRRHPMTGDVI